MPFVRNVKCSPSKERVIRELVVKDLELSRRLAVVAEALDYCPSGDPVGVSILSGECRSVSRKIKIEALGLFEYLYC
jgi:hypothetical protein